MPLPAGGRTLGGMRIEATHRIPHPPAVVSAWLERPGARVRMTPPGMAALDARLDGRWRSRWHAQHAEADPADPAVTLLHDELEIALPGPLARSGTAGRALEERTHRLLDFGARQLQADLTHHAARARAPRRTVAITGASGLVGTQLAALLESGGHTVRRLVRGDRPGSGEIRWDPRAGELDPRDLEGVDVVVHLAGRSIATRWTAAAKREIRDSRVEGTALIARTLAGMTNGPRTLVTASAIGVYGPQRPGELLTEEDSAGTGFLADLVRDWEAATAPAARAGLRVAQLRTGVVLSDGGGSLLPQLPLLLAGVGGRLAPPDAVTSWITLDDLARAYATIALASSAEGPLNAVAPHPVTQEELVRALGRTLHRPAVVPVPAAGPALLLGAEAARELVRADQRVDATRLQEAGARFEHPRIDEALHHVLWR